MNLLQLLLSILLSIALFFSIYKYNNLKVAYHKAEREKIELCKENYILKCDKNNKNK